MMSWIRWFLLKKLIGKRLIVANLDLVNVELSRPLDYFDGEQICSKNIDGVCHTTADYIKPMDRKRRK